MTMDFNDAAPQQEFSGEPIPGGTKVRLRMNIRPDQQSGSIVKQAKSSAWQYLDCELEVIGGQSFVGRKIFENLGVAGDMSNEGHKKGIDIARSKIRAILNAARGVSGDDQSPQAMTARQINDFSELSGLEFPAVIGYRKPRAGDEYVNNSLKSIIEPQKPEYQELMNGGEIVGTQTPPKIPDSPAGQQGGAAPAWAAGNAQQQAPQQPQQPQQQQGNLMNNQQQGGYQQQPQQGQMPPAGQQQSPQQQAPQQQAQMQQNPQQNQQNTPAWAQ